MTKASVSTNGSQSKEGVGRRSRLPEWQSVAIASPAIQHGKRDRIGTRRFVLLRPEGGRDGQCRHNLASHQEFGKARLIEVVREGKFLRLSFRRDVFDAYLRQLSDSLRTPA